MSLSVATHADMPHIPEHGAILALGDGLLTVALLATVAVTMVSASSSTRVSISLSDRALTTATLGDSALTATTLGDSLLDN